MLIFNNNKYTIVNSIIEQINDEFIIFIEEKDSIIVLNNTASFVFDYLCEANKNIIDIKIDVKDIAKAMTNKFVHNNVSYSQIYTDIENTIKELIDLGVVVTV